ncbi:hypothetical protein DFH09DRAFT_1098994 [Mycena vulgaris]|nr:hypothetical protein DFH09DRAFT_1098994 [Mycena vulgaris]
MLSFSPLQNGASVVLWTMTKGRVNRLGMKVSSPRWADLVLSYTRTYTVPSPEPTSSPPTSETPLAAKYLAPLYEDGWMPATPRRDGKISGALYRNFDLPSRSHLKAFLEKTRNTAASIIVRRNLQRCDVRLDAPDGVTWSTTRSALAPATIPSPPEPVQPLAPIASATLPSPPPPPPFPPPSITDPDLNLHIQPLAANGWSLTSASLGSTHPSLYCPCLHRVYDLHHTKSARDFFNAVVAAIPVPVYQSNGGVDVWFDSAGTAANVGIQYGISHADVRFALALEGMYAADWAVRTRNVDSDESSGRRLHKMEDVWRAHRRNRDRRRRRFKAPGGIDGNPQEAHVSSHHIVLLALKPTKSFIVISEFVLLRQHLPRRLSSAAHLFGAAERAAECGDAVPPAVDLGALNEVLQRLPRFGHRERARRRRRRRGVATHELRDAVGNTRVSSSDCVHARPASGKYPSRGRCVERLDESLAERGKTVTR